MQFRFLGPLQVAGQSQSAVLGGVKQRSLLALLLSFVMRLRRELADEPGLEPGEELRRLEQPIFNHDREHDAPPRPRRTPTHADRSMLVYPHAAAALDFVLRLAAALADARVVAADDVAAAP